MPPIITTRVREAVNDSTTDWVAFWDIYENTGVPTELGWGATAEEAEEELIGNAELEIGSMRGGYPHERRAANAALTAAAPDLYEALANIVSIFDEVNDGGSLSCTDYTANKVLKSARMALAKANGEQLVVDETLPDWEDLHGQAPDATGELSSEAFVRKQRDDWR